MFEIADLCTYASARTCRVLRLWVDVNKSREASRGKQNCVQKGAELFHWAVIAPQRTGDFVEIVHTFVYMVHIVKLTAPTCWWEGLRPNDTFIRIAGVAVQLLASYLLNLGS